MTRPTLLETLKEFFPELSLIFLVCASIFGCAGPTTPFGYVGFTNTDRVLDEKNESVRGPAGTGTQITFSPRHQNLHGRIDTFEVTVTSQKPIEDNYKFKIFYNGRNVSARFLKKSQQKFLDPDHRTLQVTMRDLRFPAKTDHRVTVWFKSDAENSTTKASWSPPMCDAFVPKPIHNTMDFDIDPTIVTLINNTALDYQISPAFLAGLIAQESGFDHKALSWSKALGLTQITSSAEIEITEHRHWPRYPDLKEIPLPVLKYMILKGKITGKNEWRLNPELSIQGGLTYLQMLDTYWKKSAKTELFGQDLKMDHEVESQLILASYNAGAYRVKKAIEENGKGWLSQAELQEAREYVRKIFSYCDHFARPVNNEDPT